MEQEESEVYMWLQGYNSFGITEMMWNGSHSWHAAIAGYRQFRKRRPEWQRWAVVLYVTEQQGCMVPWLGTGDGQLRVHGLGLDGGSAQAKLWWVSTTVCISGDLIQYSSFPDILCLVYIFRPHNTIIALSLQHSFRILLGIKTLATMEWFIFTRNLVFCLDNEWNNCWNCFFFEEQNSHFLNLYQYIWSSQQINPIFIYFWRTQWTRQSAKPTKTKGSKVPGFTCQKWLTRSL